MTELSITIEGTKPLLLHNGRLANPLNPWTIELKKLTGKRKKTEEDTAQLAAVEARAGCYETADGSLGLPVDNLWRTIFDAAKAFRRGADIQRALIMLSDVEPIIINGEKITNIDAWLPDHIDSRTVRPSGSASSARVLRSRPLVPMSWVVTHRFELFSDVMDVADLHQIIARAGKLQGIGDFRPRYGTFDYELDVVE